MTLTELRTKLVQESGRYDLVVDTVNYADAGADYHINSGIRHLDRISDTPFSTGVYRHKILDGEQVFQLPSFRSVDKVFIVKDGTKLEILRRDKSLLFDLYERGILSSGAAYPPRYYAEVQPNTVQSDSNLGPEALTDGSFSGDGTDWEWVDAGSKLLISGGQMKHTSGAVSTISQDVTYPGRTYLLTARVYRRSVDGAVTFDAGTNNYQFSGTGSILQEIVATDATFTITFDSDFDGWIDDVSLKEVTNSYLTRFDTMSDMVFPPTDTFTANIYIIIYPIIDPEVGYNLQAEGRVWSPTLNATQTTNYWSVEHPDLVIAAARRSLDMARRGGAGVKFWNDQIVPAVAEIRNDRIEKELAAYTRYLRHEE